MIASQGTGDSGSSTEGTPCQCLPGIREAKQLSGLVCLCWGRRTGLQEDTSAAPPECIKGPSPPGQ